MKNRFFSLMFILSSFICAGQKSSSLIKYFNNLPIDSCIVYIKTKIIDTNLYKARSSKDQEYKINTNLISGNHNMDSVIMSIKCLGLAIGGSPNQVSPIVYEQWLTNTFYFKSDSTANKFFKNQKTQLDSFAKEPYLKEDIKEIECVYSFDCNDIKRVRYRQVHLTFEKNIRKVKISYRLIFDNNECNCN